MNQKHFKLFANCIPVKGATRSVICDLQRQDYQLIPTSLYELLNESPHFTLQQLIDRYGEKERETLMEYVNFLELHEFGTWTSHPAFFPPLDLSWFSHSKITNSIVDWDCDSTYDFSLIFEQLNELSCLYLQLRFFDVIDNMQLQDILGLLKQSSITSVEIFIHFNPNYTSEDYRLLLRRFPRVTQLTIYNAPDNRYFNDPKDFLDLIALNYITQKISNESHCGVIHPGYFNTNIHHFTEAQQFNTCLNQKISIDKKGEICNCPSLEKKYGSIRNISLKEVLENSDLKANWTIHKDQIETCKVCEFRYICSDCRAYTVDNEPLGKPSKCNYDPFNSSWN